MNPATCAGRVGCLLVLVSLGLPATASAGEGACCFPDDLCLDGIDSGDCEAIDGTYLGHGTTCDGDEDGDGVVGCADLCPDTPPGLPVDEDGCPTVGACCFEGNICVDDIDGVDCEPIGGRHLGIGSTCDGDEDADGVIGCADLCLETPPGDPVDEDGCPTIGACCFFEMEVCLDELEGDVCMAIGGLYQGGGTLCEDSCNVASGDFDGDSDVDWEDYAVFVSCVTGPDGGPIGDACEPGDFDYDDDIDLQDYGGFQRVFGLGVNLPPIAVISADPTSGPAPLTVTFDAAGSFDPEDGTADLNYLWYFDESACVDSAGTNLGIPCTIDRDCPPDATCLPINATGTPTPVHTYDVEGFYVATLTVFDSLNQASDPVSIAIDVGE